MISSRTLGITTALVHTSINAFVFYTSLRIQAILVTGTFTSYTTGQGVSEISRRTSTHWPVVAGIIGSRFAFCVYSARIRIT